MVTQKKKRKSIKKAPITYKEFLRRLDLVGIGLRSTSCEIDRRAYFKLQREATEKDKAIKTIEFEAAPKTITDDHFDIHAKFSLQIEEPKTENKPLIISCEFQTHFHGTTPINKEYVERFADSEFGLIVWPYFRQFVSDTTGRMSIPPIHVPLVIQPDN